MHFGPFAGITHPMAPRYIASLPYRQLIQSNPASRVVYFYRPFLQLRRTELSLSAPEKTVPARVLTPLTRFVLTKTLVISKHPHDPYLQQSIGVDDLAPSLVFRHSPSPRSPSSSASARTLSSRHMSSSFLCQTNTPSIICAVGCSSKSCPIKPTSSRSPPSLRVATRVCRGRPARRLASALSPSVHRSRSRRPSHSVWVASSRSAPRPPLRVARRLAVVPSMTLPDSTGLVPLSAYLLECASASRRRQVGSTGLGRSKESNGSRDGSRPRPSCHTSTLYCLLLFFLYASVSGEQEKERKAGKTATLISVGKRRQRGRSRASSPFSFSAVVRQSLKPSV